jgi:hypothetical protein
MELPFLAMYYSKLKKTFLKCIYFCLFICAYNVWIISPPYPLPLPFPLPSPATLLP